MENSNDIQIQLFNTIGDQLPEHVSLVDEIAEILEISNDSAYRRIRGEKPISLHEVQKLSGHFSISVDELTGSKAGTVTFNANLLDGDHFSFDMWLRQLLQFTTEAERAEDVEVVFILNELNIFHIIQFPEICAFKIFFWQKSNLNFEAFRNAKFSTDVCSEELIKLTEEISSKFVKLNTIEFTTEESLNSFLKQVLYYSEAGYFESRDVALRLCERLHELVNHQQKQAELGFKFAYGKPAVGNKDNFRLYHNDIILADNTIMVKTRDGGTTFITSNAINLMQTHNQAFFEYNYNWGMNLLSKSVPISGTAEKERNRFFRNLRTQIDSVIEKI
jgi:hypothetical protein